VFELLAQGLRDVYVQVSSDTLSDIIPCTGWPDSYQKRNALIHQLHEHGNLLESVACYDRVYDVTAKTLS